MAFVQAVVNFTVFFLPSENLRDFCTIDALLKIGIHVGALIGNQLPAAALFGLENHRNDYKQRKSRKDNKGEPHVHKKHKDANKNQIKYFQHKVDDTIESVSETELT